MAGRRNAIEIRRRWFGRLAIVIVSVALVGCGGEPEAGSPGTPGPGGTSVAVALGSTAPAASALPGGSPRPGSPDPSSGPQVELCERVATVQSRLAELAALELRPSARVTLDIELSSVTAAFSDMRQDVLDVGDLDLDASVRRLGYRLDDLTLAVEDFRTTSRPRDAANHVAEEATLFADALAGFVLLAGC